MATPSNPGWIFGFIPTAGEWNGELSGKVDYPAPIDQGGTGAQTGAGAAYNIVQRAVIAAGGETLVALASYGVRTSVGAFTLLLPPLAGLEPGDWIDVYDIDFNANANNITITAAGSDAILLYATSSGTQVLDTAGIKSRLVVNASSWRLLV